MATRQSRSGSPKEGGATGSLTDIAEIAGALGAKVVPGGGPVSPTPPEISTLVDRFNQRLRSSGGRPTDPDWTVSRRIPFKPETWDALRTASRHLSKKTGRSVSPAQLTATLIEDRLEQLQITAERAFGGTVPKE
jgi:hypothetical protein